MWSSRAIKALNMTKELITAVNKLGRRRTTVGTRTTMKPTIMKMIILMMILRERHSQQLTDSLLIINQTNH
jgi:hypothetical protein